MGWLSYDYECQACDTITNLIIDSKEKDIPQQCESCKGDMKRLLAAPRVMNNALPDGNGRFSELKESIKLQRARTEAKTAGDRITEKKLSKELKKV